MVIWLCSITLLAGILLVAIPILIVPVIHPDPQKIPSAVHAPPLAKSSSAVEQARQLVRTRMSAENLPGVSVAVGIGQDIVWAEGFGYADLKTNTPVTPDTRFRIGTASNLLTSGAVGLLIERGRLKLDNEIQNYIPQFQKQRAPVRLQDLTAHRSGDGAGEDSEAALLRIRCGRPVEALQHFAQDAPVVEPGTQRRNSNYGWILVSAAVETASDQPFLTFMREQVFQPLGMHHTGAESSTEENPEAVGEEGEDAPFVSFIAQRILEPLGVGGKKSRPATAPATLYSPGFGGPLVRRAPQVMPTRNLSCYAGSMAFFSTPSDLVRFGLAIHNGKLLQPATVQLLQVPEQFAHGYHGDLLGRKVLSLMQFPQTGVVVAITSNGSNVEMSALARQVAEAFSETK